MNDLGESKCHWFWWGRCWHLWKSRCRVLEFSWACPAQHKQEEREGQCFPHHLHGQSQAGVHLWPWEWLQLNLVPCSDNGVGMRGSGTAARYLWALSWRAALSTAPGEAAVCPLCHPNPWVITLTRHSLCLPTLRDPGDFPRENEGLAKSGCGKACLTSRIRGFLLLTSSWKWDFGS